MSCAIEKFNWEKNLQGLRSWAWPPKFCRTCGVLCDGSAAGFLLCKRFGRTPNPKGSAEFWGGWEPISSRLIRTKTTHDSQRRDKILRFFSPPRNRAIFSISWCDSLAKLHKEKGRNPLEKFQKTEWWRRPRNCRFLSLVVVERVLK